MEIFKMFRSVPNVRLFQNFLIQDTSTKHAVLLQCMDVNYCRTDPFHSWPWHSDGS